MKSDTQIVNEVRRLVMKYRRGEFDGSDDTDNAVYALDAIERAVSEC